MCACVNTIFRKYVLSNTPPIHITLVRHTQFIQYLHIKLFGKFGIIYMCCFFFYIFPEALEPYCHTHKYFIQVKYIENRILYPSPRKG